MQSLHHFGAREGHGVDRVARDIVADPKTRDQAAASCGEAGVVLPTFAELEDPARIPTRVASQLARIGPDEPEPLNLFRVHWHNGKGRAEVVSVPEHVVLPPELTHVDAPIVVVLGDRFPLIGAHKVLAAYACLVPRLVTGAFDPARHRAIWPSTGNYCRGGVAISRLMGCRGVAVLPEGMSRERFAWLEEWVADRDDIIRTPGSESNVREIYEVCAQLDRHPENVVLNQFAEFENHVIHYVVTGAALARVFESLRAEDAGLRLGAFVSATGSAGTIGAGDYLKDRYDSLVVAAEALECPTLLRNGFGEHNIQGIGDKHVPLIHNVLNTDVVLAVSDRATDRLGLLFGTEAGRRHLANRRKVPAPVLTHLPSLGLSSIGNIVAAIKTAKHFAFGARDIVLTVATDGAAMYESERERALARYFADGFDDVAMGEVFGEHLLGATTDNLCELTHDERTRMFNLGYFTWVEQQGVSIEDFQARRDPAFWAAQRQRVHAWDELIGDFNERAARHAA